MSVARIPFTPDDERKISSLGTWMMAVAVIHFIIGGLVVLLSCCGLIGIAQMLTQGLTGILGALRGGLGLLAGPILLGQGYLLVMAKKHMDAVVQTDTDDQAQLASAFKQIKIFVMIEGVYGLMQILMGCIDSSVPIVGRFL